MPIGVYKRTDIMRRNISKASIGRKVSNETREKLSKIFLGRKRTWSSKTEFKSGSNHPNWKGGISYNKKENHKRWVKNNPDKISIYNRNSKVKRKGVIGSYTIGEWQLLKIQYGFSCPCCKKSEPEIKLTADHIIPITKGGSNFIENIQPLCLICNIKKFNKIIPKYDIILGLDKNVINSPNTK